MPVLYSTVHFNISLGGKDPSIYYVLMPFPDVVF